MKNKKVNGFWINPILPVWMDFKDIDERSESHLAKWFNVPFIVTDSYQTENYNDYTNRLSKLNIDIKIEPLEVFEKLQTENKKEWFKTWKDGTRYTVRRLDSGAHDRTTNKGSFDNLNDALNKCSQLI